MALHGCAGGGVGWLHGEDFLISRGREREGLGDEEHVSKAKFADSPASNPPCGGGKEDVWLSMRT